MSGLIRTCCLAVILFAVFVWAPGVSLPLAQAADRTLTPEQLKAAAAAATPVAITPKIVSSFQVPKNRARTITWVNDSLWLIDDNKTLYRLTANGEVQSNSPITFTAFGLTWDGVNLWSADDFLPYGTWRAFQLNATGQVIGNITGTWNDSNLESLAWVGDFLYGADYGSPGHVHKFTRTGEHILSWEPDFVGFPKGMAYDGTGLWIGVNCFGDAGNDLYRYTLLGESLNKIDLNAIGITCSYDTQNTRGLAWDGRFLWYTGDDIFKVYKLDIGVPDITLSATTLNFGTQPLQSTSAQTLTVQNTGGTTIPINSLTVSGDYALTTTCPTGGTLAAGASCTIRVNFTPSSVGTRSGVITLTHYADVRPNLVSVTGAGATPNYTLLPGSLNFGEQAVGSSSAAKSVTLQNTSSGPLPVSAIIVSGEYNQTHNCPTTLAASTSCTIFVTFAPQANGVRNGTLTVTLHPTLSPSSVTLTGMGINGPTSTPTPTVTVTPPTVTPEPSVTVTPTSTVTPLLKSWTLLIYAVGDNDLGAYMDVQLKGSMLDRLRSAGSQSQINLAVLYDGPGANDTVRYILSADGNWNPFQLPEAQMDTPTELRQFIEWGFDTFHSDHYYLSIVDHASGVLGMGVDRTTDSAGLAYLTPLEIREALTLGTGTGAHKFDVVHFDGCSFGLFENTSIVQDLADYVVASPNTGWGVFAYADYRRLAGQAPNDPRSFAQAVARQYGAAVKQEGYPYTISVFDMAKYAEVRTQVGVLGSRLASFVKADKEARRALLRQKRQEMQKYDSDDYRITDEDRYVDLRNMAVTLQTLNVMTITSAANDVLGATQAFIVHAEHVAGTATIFSQTITMDLTGAQGLSIFYPPSTFSSPGAYQRYVGNKLFPNLTTNWAWLDFLQDGVPPIGPGQPIPPEHEPLIAVLLPAAPPPAPTLPRAFLPVVAHLPLLR